MKKNLIGVSMTLVIASSSLVAPAMAQRRDGHHRVLVPSPEFPTIQAGIDAVADGGTVIIRPGVYNLDEPLRVVGKQVRLIGSGARGKHRTELLRPVPREVVQSALALGVIEYGPGGGGELKALMLRGGDAGVLGIAREGPRTALKVTGVVITETGRGILWLSDSDLTVKGTHVSHTLWHGISVHGGSSTQLRFLDTVTQIGEGFGFFFLDSCPEIKNGFAGGHALGGIGIFGVAPGGGLGCAQIKNGLLAGNFYAGIRLEETSASVEGTHIWDTAPRASDGAFGDGVLARRSFVSLTNLDIQRSARAGISNFGSLVEFGSSVLNCNTIDLDGEVDGAFPPTWQQDEENICGCGDDVVSCQVNSWNLQPPDPVEVQ